MKKLLFICTAALITFALILTPFTVGQVQAKPDSDRLPTDPSYEEIDAYIEKQLEALNIPGAALVIVEGDRIVHFKGFGVTGPEGGVPTPQTPYFIGSLTKSFTALATMQLVEAGKIELDAPIQHYLPWFTLADPKAAAQITVRHLLNQTSGIAQIPGMIALGNFDNSPGAAERQARALATYELARSVGSGWEYSNLNFSLLGLVIEAGSGETYTDYIQNHIYAPLNMHHSFTSKSEARQDGLAVGHMQWFGFPVAVPDLPIASASLAGGYLIASAEDLGHYLIAQLNQGEYAGVRVLSSDGIAQMHQPAASVDVAGIHEADYGMGWFIKEFDQKQLVFHTGEVPDYFAYMALLPEKKRAMGLLVNTMEQAYNYSLWTLGENVALWLAGQPPQPNTWAVLPWAVRSVLLLPVLQIIAIAVTLKKVIRWRLDPTSRPGPVRLWLLHILLPTILNLLLVLIAAAILASGMLKFIMLFMGDIASVLLISGVIALVWCIVRTCLILKAPKID